MTKTPHLDRRTEAPLPDLIGAFEYLTGPSRGEALWIHDDLVSIELKAGHLRLSNSAADNGLAEKVARLCRLGSSYEIEAAPGHAMWVNGARVEKKELSHGDVVEFGDKGPLSRFRLFGTNHKMRWTIDQIIGDCFAYLRTSRRPLPSRLFRATRDALRRLALETSLIFRLSVLVAIAALTLLSYQQWQLSRQLQRSIVQSAEQLEGVAMSLDQARNEALRPSDINALRDELDLRVTSNIDRLEVLERRSIAGARVVADASASVAFIQGSYGFKEKSSGRMLRQVVGADGIPLSTPRGQPLLSIEGDGPVAEIQFTGTGFIIDGESLITNRHVALPWETGTNAESYAARGLEPALLKLIAYLPGIEAPTDLELISASEDADLAVLSLQTRTLEVAGLKLAAEPPKAGEEIILMGFPTGLRSILAQSGISFIEELQKDGDTDFWNVASRLAANDLILPLASRGIVGKVGNAAIVYDAETTHGGSGGPVLNMRGEVIAVNSAILPEFGGSNLGVPVAEVRALIEN